MQDGDDPDSEIDEYVPDCEVLHLTCHEFIDSRVENPVAHFIVQRSNLEHGTMHVFYWYT